jgi:hypothetical protein
MSDSLHVHVDHVIEAGCSTRHTRLVNESRGIDIVVTHEFDTIVPWSDATPLDPHVLAIVLYASERGLDVRAHGPLTRQFMRNVHELILAWKRWRPQVYREIRVVPDHVVDARRPALLGKAIAAFSGGVDATFTASRHARLLPDVQRYPLTDVLMVHGFDVPLSRPDEFRQLVDRTKPLRDSLGLRLRTIRTNSKELGLQRWDDSFGAEVAACLHMLSHEFDHGLVGSSMEYDALLYPVGSNPIIDPLTSGDLMTIVHDGAGHSRTEKVAQIAKDEIATRSLKVCWAGPVQSDNCGVCEKCLRTRLNFLAAGHGTPTCFRGEIDEALIERIPIKLDVIRREFEGIAAHARANGVKARWLELLDRRIARAWRQTTLRRARRWVSDALDRRQLKEPARRLAHALGVRRHAGVHPAHP